MNPENPHVKGEFNFENLPLVADQCSKGALVFELVAPPLEQILLGSKHLGIVPEDPY